MNWPFWLELLVRSGALLAAGEALLLLSKASSAAFRHRLLLSALALLALLPALAVLFPEIPVSLWRPAHEVRGYVTVREISSKMLEGRVQHSLNWPMLIWIIGAVLACVPLIVGSISAWRLAQRSVQIRDSTLASLIRRLAGKTEVMLSSELLVPVTCGLLRPRILLPMEAERWSSSRLEAVLLHELAHVRRRDLAAQMGAHVIAAVWWFQPLVWVIRRQLRAASEFACDAAAIRFGFRASEYAAELLAVAKSTGKGWMLSSSAIGMVRAGDLEERLRAVLHPQVALLRWPRIFVVAVVLGVASIAASAVSLRSDQDSNTVGGSIMKRTILSALLTSAGLSAATVSGYIHDSSGSAIADAKVSIYSPENSMKQEAMTGADGKFSFSDSGGGQYILRVEKAGLASIFREFDLKSDSKMDRDFTMAATGAWTVIPDHLANPTEDQSQSPKRIRVGGQVAQSNLMTKIQPVYPASAKKAAIQGTVELAVAISKEGVPLELRVNSSPSDDLSESALEAVGQWRYRPTLLNGQPIEIETIVVVNYTLAP